jgi:hypothetical protein
MLLTFVTILAVLYIVGVVVILSGIFIAFLQLTPLQQNRATITISPYMLLGFVVAVSFLIARMVS